MEKESSKAATSRLIWPGQEAPRDTRPFFCTAAHPDKMTKGTAANLSSYARSYTEGDTAQSLY